MNIDPQWIAATASAIGCLSLLLIVWQIKANHDRERRKVALNVIQDMRGVVDKKRNLILN